VITQEDYEDTLKAARERLESMKRVEEVIVEDNQLDQAEIIEESDND
jgi:hypothetical protein